MRLSLVEAPFTDKIDMNISFENDHSAKLHQQGFEKTLIETSSLKGAYIPHSLQVLFPIVSTLLVAHKLHTTKWLIHSFGKSTTHEQFFGKTNATIVCVSDEKRMKQVSF